MVPKGVARIEPKAEIMMLEAVSPTPFRSRLSSSAAGKPLPRTRPAKSQMPTKTSSSCCIRVSPLCCGEMMRLLVAGAKYPPEPG